jgi:hypothetical protein
VLAASAPGFSAVDVLARQPQDAAGGRLDQRSTSLPTVDLPQPDSPTRHERLAAD